MKKSSKTVFTLLIMLISLFALSSVALADDENLSGGWTKAEDPTITEELKTIFESAFTGMTGATYEPVSLDAYQIVAGKNYQFTAYQTYVTPGAEKKLVKVIIYVDLEGKAELKEVVDASKDDSPKTGDTGNFVLFGILALAAAAGIVLTASRRRLSR